MEPIERLSSSEVCDLRAVCFDVDDTVTTHGTLDPQAYAAMFALRESGLRLIAVTGRPLGFAEIIARTWPVDAAVGENGAGFLARAGRVLRSGYWDSVELRSSQQKTLVAIRERVARELPEIAVSSDAWARRCDLAFDIGEQESVAAERVQQLVELLEQAGARTSVSSIHAHAQLGHHDKARGVLQVARELWQLDDDSVRDHFMFVGDSGNDAAAFAYFSLTAAVANVQAHLGRLSTPPRYVASQPYGAGFAEIAHKVIRLRGGAA